MPEIIHHVTRYSREISCDATGEVRVEEIAALVTCDACKAADAQARMDRAHGEALGDDAARDALAADRQADEWQARHVNTPRRNAYWIIDAREADHAEALEIDRR